ncbi:hypothetical protein Q3G72_000630 [Acer saccharum]|nr:hypothetical protein Q3G72_000630 [Acer saccharum]
MHLASVGRAPCLTPQATEACCALLRLMPLTTVLALRNREVLEDTVSANQVNLLSDPFEDLKRKIKRELCLESLKKVKKFERWSEAMLDELCDCIKPVSFTEHTHIVLEGDKIDEILFLVQGKLRTYLFKNVNTGSITGFSRRRTVINHLRDGDKFFGE